MNCWDWHTALKSYLNRTVMLPLPADEDEAAPSKAVNEETSSSNENANASRSASRAQHAQSSQPNLPSTESTSLSLPPAKTSAKESASADFDISNLKLPSSSSSEDMYDLFSPPVSTSARKPRNMTVVTAADSVLKDENEVILPPFRGMEVSLIGFHLQYQIQLALKIERNCNF